MCTLYYRDVKWNTTDTSFVSSFHEDNTISEQVINFKFSFDLAAIYIVSSTYVSHSNFDHDASSIIIFCNVR